MQKRRIVILIIMCLIALLLKRYFFPVFNSELLLGDNNQGDVNGDGKVSATDYMLVKKHIMNAKSLTSTQKTRADVNGDKVVNSLDYIAIRKIIMGRTIGVRVTSVTLNITSMTLQIGETGTLIATVIPSDATNKDIIWISSDESIAKVDQKGKVTALTSGNVKIIAMSDDNEMNATCSINIPSKEEKYCEELVATGVKSLDYKTFISKFPNSDDFYAIKATHDCANKHNLPVKVTKGTYNIYNKTTESIIVMTNTDLGNSTIYIHDEKGIVGTDYNNHIYKISHDKCSTIEVDATGIKQNSIISALKGSKSGYFVRLIEKNNDRRVFIRYGSEDNAGNVATDAFRVDKNGKVLDPLFWTYNNKANLYHCEIPSTTLIFKNARIYNKIDSNANRSLQASTDSVYLRRGILIGRSNTKVDNIIHAIVDTSNKEVSSVNHGYYGFFALQSAANITLSNSKVYAVKNNNDKGNSSYDITFSHVANVTLNNVVMYDYSNNESYFKKNSNQMRDALWGVTGGNNIKNITYENCVLNRIDSHTGIYNLTVKNTKLGKHSFQLIGFGDIKIDNVDAYYTNAFITLRGDYGSLWNGTVNIKNSKLHPYNDNPSYLISFKVQYDDNGYVHNFGYNLALPNVNVSGFTIDSNTTEVYVFDNSDTGKINGDLRKVSNYIKNNQFSFYYPKKDNIQVSNIKTNKGSIKAVNYYYNFGQN